jgi:hypothetical protein
MFEEVIRAQAGGELCDRIVAVDAERERDAVLAPVKGDETDPSFGTHLGDEGVVDVAAEIEFGGSAKDGGRRCGSCGEELTGVRPRRE